MSDGYKSSDKREAVQYIHNTTSQLMVKNAAEKALNGAVSLDAALVMAHKVGNQGVVVDTANHALGIKNDKD